MKFPLSMLREYVETALSAEEIGDLLTMAGFELEGIEEVEGDFVLDIKVVSNRGDGLSVFGLTREVLAKDRTSNPTPLYERAVAGFPLGDEDNPSACGKTSVTIESPHCTRYACRLIENTSNAPSPSWLQQRLRQVGQRPLGILVDLTNYVMLELGQPLHAFDWDTLSERRIVVRGPKPGEKLTTLNGIEHELAAHHLLICDADKAVAVAGVMGGAETEVSHTTKNVLLESAHFINTSVRKTRKELGLSTDASYRFERSVDPNGVVRALNRFVELLQDSGVSATLIPGVVDEYPVKPITGQVSVRVTKACELLGMEVSVSEVKEYLSHLGFRVTGTGEPFQVELPSWRPDIVAEMDLIEEIGRVHGYEKIPTLAPIGSTPLGGLTGRERSREKVREALLRLGLLQTISHSLRDVHPLDSPNWERIGPNVPGSPEMAWLRTSLWPSLAEAALRNGGKDLHLFEIGRVHGRIGGEFREGQHIAGLSTGRLGHEHWAASDAATADFFSLKAIVEQIADTLQVDLDLLSENRDPRLHPTRQATLHLGNVYAGVMGQIHPSSAEACGLPKETFLFAIDFDAAVSSPHRETRLKTISRNPAVRRDVSVLLSQSIPYAHVEAAAKQAAGNDLEKIWLADVYKGANIESGYHSLTISLQLRRVGENFTDEGANQVRDRVVAALESLGGKQR